MKYKKIDINEKIFGKSFIVLGIILILFPFIQIFCKSNFFKEHEVFYTFKDNGMTYQENEEAIFYSFPQFKRINYKDFILLKKNQKILFVDFNDLDQLENDIEYIIKQANIIKQENIKLKEKLEKKK